jgi:hypothetical protein
MKQSAIVYALKNKRGQYLKRDGGVNNFQNGLVNIATWEKPWPEEMLKNGERMEMIKVTWEKD